MQEAERIYSTVKKTVKAKYPDRAMNTPGGKCVTFAAPMVGGSSDYFFPDGRYVSDIIFHEESFGRHYGTWEFDPETNSVRIHVTKICYVVGLGEPVMYAFNYFKDYRYEEKEVNKSTEFEWFQYLYANLCNEDLPGKLKKITKEDYRLLPEHWKSDAKAFIKEATRKYKEIVAYGRYWQVSGPPETGGAYFMGGSSSPLFSPL